MKFRLVENLLLERLTNEQIQAFIDKFGENIYNKLQDNNFKKKLKSKKTTPNLEYGYLMKNVSKEQLQKAIDIAIGNQVKNDSRQNVLVDVHGKEVEIPQMKIKKLQDGTLIYKIDNVNQMIQVSAPNYPFKGCVAGQWCCAGRHSNDDERFNYKEAVKYFNNYLNYGQYFVIVKPDGNKVCLNYNKVDENISYACDQNDHNITKYIKENKIFSIEVYKFFNLPVPKDWLKEIYYWDGKCEVPESVVKVVILDSVTEIGNKCFYNCISLTHIDIPNSVTKIGNQCFYNCISLTHVDIPDSVTEIGDQCFYGCYLLTHVDIPDSVTKIGAYCFSMCKALTHVDIPNSVTKIGSGCFFWCEALTHIDIPDSVTKIGSGCFSGCRALTHVDIPDSVTEISNECFQGCYSLTHINILNSVTKIGSSCFSQCISLPEIDIPNSVTEIGDDCFYGCYSLTHINIPKKFKDILNDIGIDESRTKVEVY